MTQSEYSGKPLLTYQDVENTGVWIPIILDDGTTTEVTAPLFIVIDDPMEARPGEVLGHFVEEDKNGNPTGRLRAIVKAVALISDNQCLSYKSLRPQ